MQYAMVQININLTRSIVGIFRYLFICRLSCPVKKVRCYAISKDFNQKFLQQNPHYNPLKSRKSKIISFLI